MQPHDPFAQHQQPPQAQYVTGQPHQQVITRAQPYVVTGAPMMGAFPSTNAMLALILACASWVSCGILFSIPAVILASQAMAITAQMPGHPDHGTANAARIVGWVNIGLTIAGIGIWVLIILFGVIAAGAGAGM